MDSVRLSILRSAAIDQASRSMDILAVLSAFLWVEVMLSFRSLLYCGLSSL